MDHSGIPQDLMVSDQDHSDLGGPYFPEPTDVTGGLPINLDSLRDGPPGSKPFYPYSTLIRYAIKGSPNQKLLLEDIYYAIESRFPYFRNASNGWKNSVRHNLSLNPCFEKVARPLTDRGKGSYWTVNDNVDPRTGVHRVRKKKPKSGKSAARAASQDQDIDYHPEVQNPSAFDEPAAEFVPRTDVEAQQFNGAFTEDFSGAFDLMHAGAAQGLRFASQPELQAMAISLDEPMELDERGEYNWRKVWLKELEHLRQVTDEQVKNNVDQEWYKMMFCRVRTGFVPVVTTTPEGQVMHQHAAQDGLQHAQ